MRPNLNNLSGEKEALSLLELNTRIRGALSRAFPETCWVRAEMSDVRVNTSSGHCYLEFVEKNAQTGQLVAKVRGSIWAKTFRTPCAVIHGARGGRGVSAGFGLRPLSELYEPDGDGRLRTLPVMP